VRDNLLFAALCHGAHLFSARREDVTALNVQVDEVAHNQPKILRATQSITNNL
jgi:hypothetical protein